MKAKAKLKYVELPVAVTARFLAEARRLGIHPIFLASAACEDFTSNPPDSIAIPTSQAHLAFKKWDESSFKEI